MDRDCSCFIDASIIYTILSISLFTSGDSVMNDFTCVICDKEIKGEFGNNPDPIALEGECCNECDNSVVMTARLNQLGIG
tara:strand:- start:114 stop:353 length:240 start_codon:yes stop_codon:yes gene_type:complete